MLDPTSLLALLPFTLPLVSPIAAQSNVQPTTYSVQTPPLTTDWTYKVGTDPWTEYPRPQLRRDDWKSLNGIWTWRNATSQGASAVNSPPSGKLEREVMIPSCLESGLSGIQAANHVNDSVAYSWFSTSFEIPSAWSDRDVVINFGAVDYEATVFVNGQNATFHRGGYNRFSANITPYLEKNGTNQLAVFVHDPTDKQGTDIPLGKQTLNPSHIFYTPCTGIWQSVFIEPVPRQGYISRVDVSGDKNGNTNVTVHSVVRSPFSVKVEVFDHKANVIATASGSAGQSITFSVPDVKPWCRDSPTLYDIGVTMGIDYVTTYTGFRTVSRGDVNGVERVMINGEQVFTFGTLDQGFWPDGLYTPPSYEAMKHDLQVLKDLNFNMVRKHIKVETDLFYRATDEMGLLVMQDMPSMVADDRLPTADQQAEFERQLYEMIDLHKSFPSIFTWVIYNEAWGQLPSAPELYITPKVHALDPTRLINAVTGWDDHGAGDYHDNHHYANPQCGTPWYSIRSSIFDPSRIGFQGEFGGVGQNVSIEHLWNNQAAINTINQTYELDANVEIWNRRSHTLLDELRSQTELYACAGGVWTQTTDVEGEVNGLLTYDRRILRTYKDQWRADLQALYDAAAARSCAGG